MQSSPQKSKGERLTAFPFLPEEGLLQGFLAVLGRSYMFPFLKGDTKTAFAVETGAKSNILDGGFCGFQQVLGGR